MFRFIEEAPVRRCAGASQPDLPKEALPSNNNKKEHTVSAKPGHLCFDTCVSFKTQSNQDISLVHSSHGLCTSGLNDRNQMDFG